jgi:hypothetical protein
MQDIGKIASRTGRQVRKEGKTGGKRSFVYLIP